MGGVGDGEKGTERKGRRTSNIEHSMSNEWETAILRMLELVACHRFFPYVRCQGLAVVRISRLAGRLPRGKLFVRFSRPPAVSRNGGTGRRLRSTVHYTGFTMKSEAEVSCCPSGLLAELCTPARATQDRAIHHSLRCTASLESRPNPLAVAEAPFRPIPCPAGPPTETPPLSP